MVAGEVDAAVVVPAEDAAVAWAVQNKMGFDTLGSFGPDLLETKLLKSLKHVESSPMGQGLLQ
jgi:hypothetical protein